MNLNNLLGSIGIRSNLVGDVSFLILFLAFGLAVSFVLGKRRMVVSLLGVYAAYGIINLARFDFLKEPSTKTLVFLALLIGFVLFFSKIWRGSISGHGPVLVAKLFLGTVIVTGLSLSVVLSWQTSKELTDLITPSARKFFTDDFWRFVWSIAPLVYLGVVKRID